MTSIFTGELSLNDVFVCLDLETTGLDHDLETIIEVGAVKFRRGEVLDTFSSLANPKRQLTPFIRRLTGIQQADVDSAEPFSAIADKFRDFVGEAPVIGQNVSFDIGFLAKAGVRFPRPRLRHARPRIDAVAERQLLAQHARPFALGVPSWNAHRGL